MEACGKALNVLPKAMKMNEDAQCCCVACESIACFASCECYVLAYGIYKWVLNNRREYESNYFLRGNKHDNSEAPEGDGLEEDSKTQEYV